MGDLTPVETMRPTFLPAPAAASTPVPKAKDSCLGFGDLTELLDVVGRAGDVGDAISDVDGVPPVTALCVDRSVSALLPVPLIALVSSREDTLVKSVLDAAKPVLEFGGLETSSVAVVWLLWCDRAL